MRSMLPALTMLLATAPATAAPARDDRAAVSGLIDAFLAAERAYDSAALAKLITLDYVEVSPKGEIDAHDRFLAFYAPDKRVEGPVIDSSRRDVRLHGDTAIAIVTLAMTIPGRAAPAELRATYVARRTGRDWRLAGAQFTPVRP